MRRIKSYLALLLVVALFTNILLGQDRMTVYAKQKGNDNNNIKISKKVDVKFEGQENKEKTEIIVKYKKKNNKSVKNSLKKYKVNVKKEHKNRKIEILKIDNADNLSEVITEIQKNPDIEYVQPNYKLTTFETNELFKWDVYSLGESSDGWQDDMDTAINLGDSWNITKGNDIIVGVLDTGMDINHEDLFSNIYTNTLEIPSNGIDDDANGYIDDIHGWDFINNDNTVNDTEEETHATLIAGIIAGLDNDKGITGISSQATIMPLKFINGQSGYTSDAIEAIEYAETLGVDIMNCSWGSRADNPALYDAIQQSSMIFVSAAGNYGSDVATYPAAYNLSNVISVGSIGSQGSVSEFSNFGQDVDLFAPGEAITSLTPSNQYGVSSGTSIAAPFVSATAALVKAANTSLDAALVVDQIKRNVEITDYLSTYASTSGRLDVYSAVTNQNTGTLDDTIEQEEIGIIEIFELIDNIDLLQNASEEDKSTICNYFNVQESYINEAQALGYELIDSISIAKAVVDTGFNVSQITSLVNAQNTLKDVIRETYSYYYVIERYQITGTDKTTTDTIFFQGTNGTEIGDAYIVAEALNETVNTYLKNEQEGDLQTVLTSLGITLIQSDIDLLTDFFTIYDIHKTTFLNYMTNNNLTVSEIIDQVNQYHDIVLEQYLIATGEIVTIQEFEEMEYNEYFTSPYDYRIGKREDIGANTGALSIEENDLTLQGTNGLDLNIITKYDSSNANLLKPRLKRTYDTVYNVYAQLRTDVILLIPYYELGDRTLMGSFSSLEEAEDYMQTLEDEELVIDIYDTNTVKKVFEKSHDVVRTSWGQYNPLKHYNNSYNPSWYDGYYSIDEGGYKGKIHQIDQDVIEDNTETWTSDEGVSLWKRTTKYLCTYEGTLSKKVETKVGRIEYTYDNYEIEKIKFVDGYKTATKNGTYNEEQNQLGAGWSFGFSSIEIDGNDKFLHLSSGARYKISITTIEGDSNLKDYELKDIRLENDNGSCIVNGVTSSYVLNYKDGKKEYFASDGRLIRIQDRFNNYIDFSHIQIDGHYVISDITDTTGRVVNFTYSNTATGKKVELSYSGPNGNLTIQYYLEPITNYSSDYKLVKKVDQIGRETIYDYDINNVGFSITSKTNRGTNNTYANLTKIQYPTGAETEYKYEKAIGYMGSHGSTEYFRIIERKDCLEQESTYNKQTFTYSDNYTGYGNSSVSNPYSLPDDFTYSVISINIDGIKTITTFNNEHLPINIKNYNSDNVLISEEINRYDDSTKLLNTKQSKAYNVSGNTISMIENFTYDADGYGNQIGYWDSQALRDSNNQPIDDEYKIAYSYDSTYHFITSMEYKKDSNTYIKIEYLPNASGTGIEDVITSEKVGAQPYVVKQKTKNLYDSYGNIIEQRNYLEGTDSTWTDYISTFYDYNDNVPERVPQLDGVFLTRKWTTGVKDSDGILITPRSGLSAGIIDERYEYDINGNVIKYYDGQGNVTQNDYDVLGRLTKTIHPDNSYVEILYDDSQNSVIVTNENGYQVKKQYDGFGNHIETIDVATGDILSKIEYDNMMRVKKETTADNHTQIQYQYSNDGRLFSQEVYNKYGQLESMETYVYDDAYNNQYMKVTKTIKGEQSAPDMVTVSYKDTNGNQVKSGYIKNNTEYLDQYTYDYLGNMIELKSSRHIDENWIEEYTVKNDYDYAGRITKTYNIFGDDIATEYDSLGRKIKVTDIKGNMAAVPYSTEYQYDNAGRLILEKTPFEQEESILYYSETKHGYDRNGNQIKTEIKANKSTEADLWDKKAYEYDTRNRLITVITYDSNQPENYTQYYYDSVGNQLRMYTGLSSPLTIIGLDNVSGADTDYSVNKYEYDSFNRIVKFTDALNQDTTYEYDLNGNLIKEVDRNQSELYYAYDGHNRLIEKWVINKDSSKNTAISYKYTLTGQKKSMQGGQLNTTYKYDELGRLVEQKSNNSVVKQYTYDVAGNKKSMVTKVNGITNLELNYDYDKLNRLENVKEGLQSTAIYTYDDNGNRETLTYNNGNSTTYEYNLFNRPTKITNMNGVSVLSDFEYDYSLDGNQTKERELVSGKTVEYVYDGLGRLETEKEKLNDTTISTISYTYDDYNNRQTMTNDSGVTTYEYDKNNRLVKENKEEDKIINTHYFYDKNGNQISMNKEEIIPYQEGQEEKYALHIVGKDPELDIVTFNEYDGFNRLIKVISGDTTSHYTYNADGLRISKTVNDITKYHIWDGNQIVLELNDEYVVTNKYIRGINLIRAEETEGSNPKYYLFNGHGDVVQLTGTDGNISKTYEYDAFGNEKNPDENDNNVFRYCGEYFDKETGTIYLRARYYNPVIGRFISEDTYLGNNSDPLSLNLYTYCANNPILYIDPSGHSQILTEEQKYFNSLSPQEQVNYCEFKIKTTENVFIKGYWASKAIIPLAILRVQRAREFYSEATVYGSNGILTRKDGEIIFDITVSYVIGESVNRYMKISKGTRHLGRSSEVELLLDTMPELAGSNRDKLLSVVQNKKLSSIVNELYRPGAKFGDGGTATKLMQEFYEGSTKHLNKAKSRLNELNKLANSGDLGLNDLDIVDALRMDLENAIKLFD